jgi:hypothetical protein
MIFGTLALLGLGCAAFFFLTQREVQTSGDEAGRVFVVFDQPAPKAAEFLEYAGFEVDHGTMNDWLRRIGDAQRSPGGDSGMQLDGSGLERVVEFAEEGGAAHIALETPSADELATLAGVVEIPPAPEGARWLAVPIGDHARKRGAVGTWADPDRPWIRQSGVGALEALMRQPDLSQDALESGRGMTKARLERAEALEFGKSRLEGIQRMVRRRERFVENFNARSPVPGTEIVTGQSRSGEAIPVDANHWVSLTATLTPVSLTGHSLEVERSASRKLELAGFELGAEPVLDGEGAPVLVPGESRLVPSRDGRAFFVRIESGAQRAYAVETATKDTKSAVPRVRQLGKFSAPRTDERHSRSLNARGQLVRVVDDGHVSWLRVYDGDDTSVDLAPVPEVNFGRARWIDEHQLIVTGRPHAGDRADTLWLFDLRQPDRAKALRSSKLGRTPRGGPKNAAPSRLGDFVVGAGNRLFVVESHHSSLEIVPVDLARNARGEVTGIGRVGSGWKRESINDLMGSAEGQTLCWRGREPQREYLQCGLVEGGELIDGPRLRMPASEGIPLRSKLRRHLGLSPDGRLLVSPLKRESNLLDDPAHVAFAWKVELEAWGEDPSN